MTVTGKGGEEEDVFRVKEEEDMTVTVKEEEEKKGERPDYHSDTRKSPTGVSDPVTSKPARLFPVVKRDLSGNHG
eukprot:XP_014042055.1 PREDICTED: uncharacterized protein LOC106595193 isoform X2 [Salmo salar]